MSQPTRLEKLSKPPFPESLSSIIKALEGEFRRMQERVREEIYRDPLTSLLNFPAFESLWRQSPPQSAHLLFVEVDEMKSLNNRFGHDDADRFLEALGQILREECETSRAHQQGFHISGDEFLLLAHDLRDEQVAALAVRLLRRVCEFAVVIAGNNERFTVSIGVVSIGADAKISPREAQEGSKLARDLAEQAVKQAKRDGRNCFRRFEDVQPVEERVSHRRGCPACMTHFSLDLPRSDFDARTHLYCPACGEEVPKFASTGQQEVGSGSGEGREDGR